MAAPHIEFFTVDVPDAGTAVQVANTSRKVLKAWVKGSRDNSADVYFGDSSVSVTTSGMSFNNTEVAQLFDFTEAPVLQSTFYVDADTNGDNVDIVMLLE